MAIENPPILDSFANKHLRSKGITLATFEYRSTLKLDASADAS